jgi:TatA/E family protein of Tat protein translocase
VTSGGASGAEGIHMPQLGGAEILVILVLVVLVFGPNRLPELSRNLGKGVRELRKIQNEFKRELKDAMPPELDEVRRELRSARRELDDGLRSARRDLDDAVRPVTQGTRGTTPEAPRPADAPSLAKPGATPTKPTLNKPTLNKPSLTKPANRADSDRPTIGAGGLRLTKGGPAEPSAVVGSVPADDLDDDPAFGRGVDLRGGAGDGDR